MPYFIPESERARHAAVDASIEAAREMLDTPGPGVEMILGEDKEAIDAIIDRYIYIPNISHGKVEAPEKDSYTAEVRIPFVAVAKNEPVMIPPTLLRPHPMQNSALLKELFGRSVERGEVVSTLISVRDRDWGGMEFSIPSFTVGCVTSPFVTVKLDSGETFTFNGRPTLGITSAQLPHAQRGIIAIHEIAHAVRRLKQPLQALNIPADDSVEEAEVRQVHVEIGKNARYFSRSDQLRADVALQEILFNERAFWDRMYRLGYADPQQTSTSTDSVQAAFSSVHTESYHPTE